MIPSLCQVLAPLLMMTGLYVLLYQVSRISSSIDLDINWDHISFKKFSNSSIKGKGNIVLVTYLKPKEKSMGGEMKQGYGAARQKGQGLQDENLIPGKSMDYYKDLI